MAKGLTKLLSNLGVEKGKGVVANAVNVSKNGGAAYKRAMTANGLGDRMSAKISAGFEDASKAMQSDKFKALADDLKGMNSAKDVVKTMADGRALGRSVTAQRPNFSDYVAASKEVAKDYFWTGATKGQRVARIGTAAAGYGVATGTARYISGGSVQYNSKGERDIAGIPFM